MSALRPSRATPPPAPQPTVLTRTTLATHPIRRINDTHHWPLSTPYRSNVAAHCAIVVESTATLSAARPIAIVQIPITIASTDPPQYPIAVSSLEDYPTPARQPYRARIALRIGAGVG